MLKTLILRMKNPKQWVILLICLITVLIGSGFSIVYDLGYNAGYLPVGIGIIVGIFWIVFIIVRWKDLVN